MEVFRVKEGFLACTYYDMYYIAYNDDSLIFYGTSRGGLRKPIIEFPDVEPRAHYKHVDKNHIVFGEQVHFEYDVGKREMSITHGDKKVTVKYETKEQKWNDENPGPSVVYRVVLREEGNPLADLSWVLQVGGTMLSYPAQMDVKVPANRIEEFLAVADDRWIEVSRRHN